MRHTSEDRKATAAFLNAIKRHRERFADPSVRAEAAASLLESLDPESLNGRIFTLAVVESKTAKCAASALHCSRRQFYRYYNRMLDAVHCIRSRPRITTLPADWSFHADLDSARALASCGKLDAAEETLTRLPFGALERRNALSVVAARAELSSQRAQFDAAAKQLRLAQSLVAAIEPEHRPDALRTVAMARSRVAYEGGFYGRAIALARDARRCAGGSNRTDARGRRSLLRDSIYLGVLHQEAGNPHEADAQFDEALAHLRSIQPAPAAEESFLYAQLAIAASASPSRAERAEQFSAKALQIAEWHGLVYERVWAYLAHAYAKLVSNRSSEALRTAHAALALARGALTGDGLARTLFIAARIETAFGSPQRALLMVDEARAHVHPAGLLGGIIHICDARVHHATRNWKPALDAAERAIELSDSRHSSHYVGMAYLTRAAVSLEAYGIRRPEDADRAVDLLQRGSPLNDYASALELRSKLTGRRRDMTVAKELRLSV